VRAVEERHGGIDLLVNNAGGDPLREFHKAPGSHRSRWPDRLYTDLAWGGAVQVVWPTSMR
jgi:NAD(P)-dependent dehydrogenase (short-subunit alcohol dehydrogenase family)